jgi:replicative DNA helicase
MNPKGNYTKNYNGSKPSQYAQDTGAARRELRVPPHSIDAEKAVLGSIMLRQEAITDIVDIITDESFYSEKNRMIFRIMLELSTKNEPIDLLSVKNILDGRGLLEQAGGAAYLAELVHSVPSAANINHYAKIVEKKHMMRNLIHASEFISQIGFDEEGELDEILDQAEKRVFDLTNKGSAHKFQAIKEALVEQWETIDRLHNAKDELRGVPTGFKDIDAKLAGLQKSDLIILAARPSVGKTSFALDIARNAAVDHNIPVGIFSLEMSAQQLTQRMLASASRVDSWKLRTAKNLQEDDFGFLRDGLEKLSNAPIFIDDQPGNNILKMRSVARRLKAEKGLGLIIVDYLQLMVPVQSKNNDNLVQQVTEISRSLKNLARELDVPVLALSQLSRAVEQRGGKPRLSDLRDSGSIEQDADVVMFIHREDRYKDHSERDNMAEILIEKHRNGATGSVMLKFDDKHTSFLSVDTKSGFGDFEEHM